VSAVSHRDVADDLSEIGAAAAWVDARVRAADLPADLSNDVHVCLEEALANLIMHGRARAGAKDIRLDLDVAPGAVTMVVSDRCVPFDVTTHRRASGEGDSEENRIGGHGIVLLRAFTSDLSYQEGPDRNELRMIFHADAESELLRAIPALAQIAPSTLAAIVKSAKRQDFVPAETLLIQGEPSAVAVILLSGEVLVINAGPHGEAVLARIAAPALIGEIGALANLPRTASVRAATRVRALIVAREALVDAARQAPELLLSVIGQLGQQLVGINGALGLYAAGLAALERDNLDTKILDTLNNPTAELRNFADAFKALARRVTVERRTRNEMASAALIQASMAPAPLDEALLQGRCAVFGAMKPAREVGGDLFDHFMLDENRLALVIGDVCGKGVPAALFMCVTATALRLAAQQHQDLSAVVAQANAALCAKNTMSMFSTLFYGILDLDTRRLDYVNCGHNPPMLIGAVGGCAELPGHGLPLGMFPDQTWTTHAVDLQPGDGVFLFSDGITECVNAAGEEFGEERLKAALSQARAGSAADLVGKVLADAERFSAGQDQFDDMTCIAALLP
jgi:phosphoserine phosphatase RsbU/P